MGLLCAFFSGRPFLFSAHLKDTGSSCCAASDDLRRGPGEQQRLLLKRGQDQGGRLSCSVRITSWRRDGRAAAAAAVTGREDDAPRLSALGPGIRKNAGTTQVRRQAYLVNYSAGLGWWERHTHILAAWCPPARPLACLLACFPPPARRGSALLWPPFCHSYRTGRGSGLGALLPPRRCDGHMLSARRRWTGSRRRACHTCPTAVCFMFSGHERSGGGLQ